MATESALPLVPVALGAAQVEQGGNDYVGQLPVRRLVPVIMIVNFQRYAGRDAACSLSGSFLSSDVDARAWAAGARVVGVEAVDSTLTQDFSSAQASRPKVPIVSWRQPAVNYHSALSLPRQRPVLLSTHHEPNLDTAKRIRSLGGCGWRLEAGFEATELRNCRQFLV